MLWMVCGRACGVFRYVISMLPAWRTLLPLAVTESVTGERAVIRYCTVRTYLTRGILRRNCGEIPA